MFLMCAFSKFIKGLFEEREYRLKKHGELKMFILFLCFLYNRFFSNSHNLCNNKKICEAETGEHIAVFIFPKNCFALLSKKSFFFFSRVFAIIFFLSIIVR